MLVAHALAQTLPCYAPPRCLLSYFPPYYSPRLDVGVDPLVGEAAAAEIDDLDRAAVLVAQQDVLRLEVAVDQVVAAQEPD
jgi:hypothetical protein